MRGSDRIGALPVGADRASRSRRGRQAGRGGAAI